MISHQKNERFHGFEEQFYVKKFLLSTFFTSALMAEPALYVGLVGGFAQETFTLGSQESYAEAPTYKIQAGYGDISAYAVEVGLSYVDYTTNIFSPEGDDGYALSFDIYIIKSFDFDIGFYPMLKAGFGLGNQQVDRELESSLNSGSFNFSGGLYYPVGEHVDIEAGVEYKIKSWESITLISSKADVSSSVLTPYLGINFRF
jgi:hypothetical protein